MRALFTLSMKSSFERIALISKSVCYWPMSIDSSQNGQIKRRGVSLFKEEWFWPYALLMQSSSYFLWDTFVFFVLVWEMVSFLKHYPKTTRESYIDICINSESEYIFWLKKTNKWGSKSSFTTPSFSDKCNAHRNSIIILWNGTFLSIH